MTMISQVLALLFASGEAITKKEIASLCNVDVEKIDGCIPELRTYALGAGLSIIQSGNELQLVTAPIHSELITELLKKDLEGELTPATLQVLTIIAYLGTVTRGDISYIRGVQSNQSIRTLSARGLVSRKGEHCALTLDALRHLGIEKVEDLPEYNEIHADLTHKLQLAKKQES